MNKLPIPKKFKQKVDRSFQRFRLGLALFFVGFVTLYSVEKLLQPSLLQEGLAVFALLVISSGLSLALWAEVMFIAYRVIGFFSSK